MGKILFLSNCFHTLYAYRDELISKLVADGHDIYLSLPASEENSYFSRLGCKIVVTDIARRGTNPFKDIRLIIEYWGMMSEIKPDIIFSYTIKPNIYGTMVSNALRLKQVCNITGTGGVFLKNDFLSYLVAGLYRLSVKKCYKVFFQNKGDRDFFISHRMVKNNWEMIPGSGCNLSKYPFTKMPNSDTISFIYIGRVMRLKGIDDYVECARAVKCKYPNTRFIIAGWCEEDAYKLLIEEHEKLGYVEYVGFQKDINAWIAKCHCTILPSLGGEGIPNALLETAAAGRVCIASAINGSIDVVDDGVTGFLFDAGNVHCLIHVVELFINLSADERGEMGLAGHRKVAAQFDRNAVVQRYCELINDLG